MPSFKNLSQQLTHGSKKSEHRAFLSQGSILMAKADQLAEKIGIMDFKANIGWLNRFKAQYEYSFKIISGKANAVRVAIIDEWISGKLPTILEEYSPKDIFNADETAPHLQVTA